MQSSVLYLSVKVEPVISKTNSSYEHFLNYRIFFAEYSIELPS